MVKVILASNSPRRKEILQNLHIPFEVVPFNGPEKSSAIAGDEVAKELALTKAQGVAAQLASQGVDLSDTLLIGADTVVVHNLKILGKPRNKKQALAMLQKLQGRNHFVITGLALIYNGQTLCQSTLTKVCFDPVDDSQLMDYIKSKEPMDKAGAYAIQGYPSLWIRAIEGDYFNVVGFPVNTFGHMVTQLGLTIKQLQQ